MVEAIVRSANPHSPHHIVAPVAKAIHLREGFMDKLLEAGHDLDNQTKHNHEQLLQIVEPVLARLT